MERFGIPRGGDSIELLLGCGKSNIFNGTNELGLARRPSYFLPIKRSTQVASAYVNNLTYKIQAGKGGGGGVEVVKKTGRGHR